jgi:N-acetylglutamate synthase-like GNAT family acetyltransferase
MDYMIREADQNDMSGICRIRNNKDLFTKYFNQIEKKEVFFIIAEHNKTILGFGVLKLIGNMFPKLSDLYIMESYRNRGIGSRLIKYQEEIACDLGFNELFVSVDPIENKKMIHLITKLNYHPICEPYVKTAVFYKEDGTAYNHTYTRIDLNKILDN